MRGSIDLDKAPSFSVTTRHSTSSLDSMCDTISKLSFRRGTSASALGSIHSSTTSFRASGLLRLALRSPAINLAWMHANWCPGPLTAPLQRMGLGNLASRRPSLRASQCAGGGERKRLRPAWSQLRWVESNNCLERRRVASSMDLGGGR